MTVHFLDLFDDILLNIAYQCTASDVFALEKTCKTLWHVFSRPNRPLWLHFLRGLDDFHAPNLPPHITLDTLSSDDLKRLVFHAMIGFANWHSASSSGPCVTQTRVIDLKNTGVLGSLDQGEHCREITKIIPGRLGEAFVFLLWSEGYLQCWDTERNRIIWTYPQLGSFQMERVVAFDAELDKQNDLLFIAIVGESLESTYGNESAYFMKTFWLNPETKHATANKTKEGFLWVTPSALKLCGDAIIIVGSSRIAISSRSLKQCFTLICADIIMNFIEVSDGYLYFVALEEGDKVYSLIAMDVQHVFTHPRMRGISCGFQPQPKALELKRQLYFLRLKEPLPISAGSLVSTQIVACNPTWRGSGETTRVFVAAKLRGSTGAPLRHGREDTGSTSYWFGSFHFMTSSNALPPSLALHRSKSVSIPLSHSYCSERVHSFSRAGRGILASVNNLHHGARYYAIAFDELLDGRLAHTFRPISFGRDLVAPGEVFFDKYNGALAFVSKDRKRLIIQYYD